MTFEVKIKQFWEWFEKNMDESAEKLSSESEKYLSMINQMMKMDEGLVVDVNKIEAEIQQLIVSANGNRSKFGKVIKMVDAAPKDLKYWKVQAFRQPLASHLNVNIDGLFLETSNSFYEVLDGKSEKVLLNIWIIGLAVDARLKKGMEVMVENKVGEFVYATRVDILGVFQVNQQKDYAGNLLPIVRIHEDSRVMGEVS